MKISNKQKGAGIIKLLFMVVALGIAGIYGTQIGIAYLDKQVIEKATKSILIEAKNNDKIGPKDIQEYIFKKISVNNIELSSDDVLVTKEGNGYNVQISFSKEIGINKDMRFIMDFSIDESTP